MYRLKTGLYINQLTPSTFCNKIYDWTAGNHQAANPVIENTLSLEMKHIEKGIKADYINTV